MANPDRINALIRSRWYFAAGMTLGGALVHFGGIVTGIIFGAGMLSTMILSTIADSARLRPNIPTHGELA